VVGGSSEHAAARQRERRSGPARVWEDVTLLPARALHGGATLLRLVVCVNRANDLVRIYLSGCARDASKGP